MFSLLLLLLLLLLLMLMPRLSVARGFVSGVFTVISDRLLVI